VAEFFRHFHAAERFAVALRVGLAEVAEDALLGVAALLVANHHYFVAVIAGETADDGRIVAERAVAMNFTPVSEEALYVIQREWTLGVARKFRPMPGIDVRADLFPQKVDLVLEMFELEMGFVVLAGPGLKLDDLLLNGFQLPLRFNCWIQE